MMKFMVITCSPNKDGLTAACGEMARQGIEAAGEEAVPIRLNDLSVGQCKACRNGWGTCGEKNFCEVEDDFQQLHKLMKEMVGFIIITPVYWWDMSESAKAFLDRVRRCEAFKKENTFIAGKPIICVAAAGGTGNGLISCLETMEKFVDHVKGLKFDFIGVTQKNREYKIPVIYEASKLLATTPIEN